MLQNPARMDLRSCAADREQMDEREDGMASVAVLFSVTKRCLSPVKRQICVTAEGKAPSGANYGPSLSALVSVPSHRTLDGPTIEEIASLLRAKNRHRRFLGRHPGHGILVGKSSEQVLQAPAWSRSSRVCVVPKNFVASRWFFAEVALAKSLGRLILPVIRNRRRQRGTLRGRHSQDSTTLKAEP